MTEAKEKSAAHLCAALENMDDYYVGYFEGITERLAIEAASRREKGNENGSENEKATA